MSGASIIKGRPIPPVPPCRRMPVRTNYTADELREYSQDVNYGSIIGEARVVFLGEIHHNEVIRREVVKLIAELAEMGFTHFAMELFHSASQTALDYYAEGRYSLSKDDVVDQEMVWRNNTQEFDDRKSIPPDRSVYYPYFEIVDAALDKGMKVIGMEWCRYDGHSLSYHSRETLPKLGLTKDVLRKIDSEEGPHGHVMGELYNSIFEQHAPVRNWHAVNKVLAKVLEKPESRVAILGGKKHYGHIPGIRGSFSVNTLLESFTGERGPVIYYSVFEETKTSRTYESSPNIAKAVFDAASNSSIGQKRFMVRMEENSEENIDRPDFIVHLP